MLSTARAETPGQSPIQQGAVRAPRLPVLPRLRKSLCSGESEDDGGGRGGGALGRATQMIQPPTPRVGSSSGRRLAQHPAKEVASGSAPPSGPSEGLTLFFLGRHPPRLADARARNRALERAG